MGEPAAGLRGAVGQLRHPQPVLRCLGQLDQDLVVVHGQLEGMQVPVQLADEELGKLDVGAPGALLFFGEPASGAGSRDTVSGGLCRHSR
jgi:hypothetical protein